MPVGREINKYIIKLIIWRRRKVFKEKLNAGQRRKIKFVHKQGRHRLEIGICK